MGYGAFAFIALFDLFFAFSWGPCVWLIQSEIFPLRVRAKGTGIATMANWLGNAAVGKLQPLALDAIGPNLYLVYAVFGLLMAGFVAVCVPETAGKTLEEMDDLFIFQASSKDGVFVESNSLKPISKETEV